MSDIGKKTESLKDIAKAPAADLRDKDLDGVSGGGRIGDQFVRNRPVVDHKADDVVDHKADDFTFAKGAK